MSKEKTKYLVITAAAGVAFWVLSEGLFPWLTETLFTPVGIGLYYLFFGLVLIAVLVVLNFMNQDMSDKANSRNFRESLGLLAVLLIALLLFAGLFEFLYELEKEETTVPTSYIFLIDDSGSMASNDPQVLRADAISAIMRDDRSMPYAVYQFTTETTLLKKMSSYSSGDEQAFIFQSDGGTDILGAVRFVVDDLESGTLTGVGSNPRIILLSDGQSGTFGTGKVVQRCQKNGVTICSVGFGSSDNNFLKKLANKTGGGFVYCDNVSGLAESMRQAITAKITRNLLSVRFMYRRDLLYCILRLLFLTLLSAIWTAIKMYASIGQSKNDSELLMMSMACCLLGTLLVEFVSRTGVPISIVRLLNCVLWALTFGTVPASRKRGTVDLSIPDPGFPNTTASQGSENRNILNKEKKTGDGSPYTLSGSSGSVPGAGGHFAGGSSAFSSGNRSQTSGNNAFSRSFPGKPASSGAFGGGNKSGTNGSTGAFGSTGKKK